MHYYDEIKKELVNNEINRNIKNYSINRSDLNSYYNVGKMLNEAGKHYGEGIIKEYSKKLKIDLNKNYSVRLLYRMLKYYNFVSEVKVPTLSAKLSWSHYDEILRFDDISKISYYIKISEKQNLSIRQLRNRIKSNEYERLDDITREKLIKNEKVQIGDYIKNPLLIRSDSINIVSEKALKYTILENITDFMKELGEGYSFIDSEYKISDYGINNYIDLLFYNYIFNCFVVVELKVTELKKEHVGQIQIYMNYVDLNLKGVNQNNTIGIIVCKSGNDFIMHYCNNKNIYQTTYLTLNDNIIEYV